MADVRINALVTTAATSASDDYLAVDGTTNAARKLSAYSPSFGGNLSAATVTTSGAATLNSVVTSTITGSPTISGNLTVSGTSIALGRVAATDSVVAIDAPATTNAAIVRFLSGGVQKWYMGRGAGDGSDDFKILTGASAIALSINNSTLATTVGGNLTVSGTASSIASSLSIDGAELSGRFLYLRTGTSPRWSVRANSTAESGALAGSDFAIANYSDAGAYLTDVFTIARATGNTGIYGYLTVSGTGTSSFSSDVSIANSKAFKFASVGNQISYFSGSTYHDSDAGHVFRGPAAASVATLTTTSAAFAGNLTVSGTGSQQVGGVGSRLILQGGTADTPASAAASGTAGSVVWDASYIYVCTATNTWKRAAIATW